jgi:hypothetical protein
VSTLREQAIAAIVDRLSNVGTFTVVRNETAPAAIDDGGYVVVRDGVREEVDRTLGIASYWITHRISVEAIVGGGDPNGALDALLQAIEQALGAEPQLAPGVTFVECDLADIETISVDGAETFKAALLDVVVEYETSNSLD